MQEVIPAELLAASRLNDFLAWIRALSLDREDKRLILRLWADRVGVPITGDMIKRAGIEQ